MSTDHMLTRTITAPALTAGLTAGIPTGDNLTNSSSQISATLISVIRINAVMKNADHTIKTIMQTATLAHRSAHREVTITEIATLMVNTGTTHIPINKAL